MNSGSYPPAPPGWYPDPGGLLRWWDGIQWVPAQPPVSEETSGRTLAILSHLGAFFGGFLVPLVVYLMEGKKNRFVRHHASEALNFQITFMIAWFAGFVLFFGLSALQARTGTPIGLVVVFPLFFLVFFLGFLVLAVLSIVGAVRASQQQWWRYPISIRFVRGAERI